MFRIVMLSMALAALVPRAHAASPPGESARVDTATLDGKLVVGFQGWFMCPGDGRARDNWWHWFTANSPDPSHVHFDLLPDTSELAPAERCPTALKTADGRPTNLFSDQNPRTVLRQFQWMRRNGIETAALQRFIVDIDPVHPVAGREAVDRVLANVRQAAERTRRGFFVMYDIAGADPETWAETLARDWKALVAAGLTRSSTYQRHRARPVLAIAGIGADGRPGTAEETAALLRRLRAETVYAGGVTLMASVPTGWRALDGDTKRDPAWAGVYRMFDVLSPWTVGRYRDEASYRHYLADRLMADVAAARRLGIDYMPVIFPGFSWSNLQRASGRGEKPLDAIPRHCGRFFWMQAQGGVSAGATMLYGAMYDEVDEGTALFKLVPSRADLPATPALVPLDIDDCQVPSDWYLRLAGAATRLLQERDPRRPFPPIPLVGEH